MTNRLASASMRRWANTMPVSAALMARESLSPESAVRRLLCATTAIAAASEEKTIRNIIASTLETPRRRDTLIRRNAEAAKRLWLIIG